MENGNAVVEAEFRFKDLVSQGVEDLRDVWGTGSISIQFLALQLPEVSEEEQIGLLAEIMASNRKPLSASTHHPNYDKMPGFRDSSKQNLGIFILNRFIRTLGGHELYLKVKSVAELEIAAEL